MHERRFIGIDGESYTVNGSHRYVLLASSLGEYVYDEEGLSTSACFNFLLSQRARAKRYIFVGFGVNYDVNMMLRDVGKEKLKILWTEKRLNWYGYRLEWIPGKWFQISKDGKAPFRIYDVFGFFQKSFVNSLKAWNIEPPEEMVEMKAARSDFDESQKQRVIDYCISECKALVTLMDQLKEALQSVNLCPTSWVGAGSIAAGILRKHDIRSHHRHDFDFPEPVQKAILHAYFGGRVELFQQGNFERLTDYDVRSAYPSMALSLPSFDGGDWHHTSKLASLPYGLYRVSWRIDSKHKVTPFPVRYRRSIFYPLNGEGWYHAAEVKRAVEIYGDAVRIEEGWVFEPSTDAKPFDFIRAEFQHRARLKREGHPGEKVLKLGLNAIYGKLAQGHGFRGKLPPFQSYYWAGFLTSGTRAKLLDAASLAPNELVMIATDGIFFDGEGPDIYCEDTLGGWEKSEIRNCFVAQPGVYAGDGPEGHIARSRGFFAKEIDFDAIRAGYLKHGPTFSAEYSSTRFVGLGSALARNELAHWRKWHEGTRKLSLYPARKFIRQESHPAPTSHYPPTMPEGTFSQMYVPKDGELDWQKELEIVEHLQGMEQPLVDF